MSPLYVGIRGLKATFGAVGEIFGCVHAITRSRSGLSVSVDSVTDSSTLDSAALSRGFIESHDLEKITWQELSEFLADSLREAIRRLEN